MRAIGRRALGTRAFDAFVNGRSHYDVLGVTRTASLADLKKAFYARAKALHPDTYSGTDKESAVAEFVLLAQAFEVLSNAAQRREYDASVSGRRSDGAASYAAYRAASAASSTQYYSSRSRDFRWNDAFREDAEEAREWAQAWTRRHDRAATAEAGAGHGAAAGHQEPEEHRTPARAPVEPHAPEDPSRPFGGALQLACQRTSCARSLR